MTNIWRVSMAVGDEMIDADHRKLIDLINTVELTLLAPVPGGNADLASTLNLLTLYTKVHFEREENLMRHLSYSGLVHHRQAHRDLRVELTKIRASIEAAKVAEVAPTEVEPVRNFVCEA